MVEKNENVLFTGAQQRVECLRGAAQTDTSHVRDNVFSNTYEGPEN